MYNGVIFQILLRLKFFLPSIYAYDVSFIVGPTSIFHFSSMDTSPVSSLNYDASWISRAEFLDPLELGCPGNMPIWNVRYDLNGYLWICRCLNFVS